VGLLRGLIGRHVDRDEGCASAATIRISASRSRTARSLTIHSSLRRASRSERRLFAVLPPTLAVKCPYGPRRRVASS